MRDINHWRLALEGAAPWTVVEPSSKAKDAGLWRRNKGEKQSQFMRGQQLQEYRKELEAKDKARA